MTSFFTRATIFAGSYCTYKLTYLEWSCKNKKKQENGDKTAAQGNKMLRSMYQRIQKKIHLGRQTRFIS